MTDLSGITVTAGVLPEQQKEALGAALDRVGGKLIDTVRIDTTHFVCTEGRGPLWEKAVEMNIPVVTPEWVDACEAEGTIVSVRGYYLNADPKARQLGPIHASTQHQRTMSTMTANTQNHIQSQSQSRLSLQPQPTRERQESVAEPPITPFPGAGMSGQPKAEDSEGPSDDEDEQPPPPPPKDESEAAESPEPAPNGHAEQNGEADAAETAGSSEKEDKAGNEKEEDVPEKAEETKEESSGDEVKKGKGKEGEGDFNEVPL